MSADVTQQANEKQRLIPMLEQIEENLGEIPDRALADPGYFSEENVKSVACGFMEPFIPRDRTKHTDAPVPSPSGRIRQDMSLIDLMLRKLKTKAGKAIYSKRKESVEPVFGQTKQTRGIRGFLLGALEHVKGEWNLVWLTHNILKLWRRLWLDEERSAPALG